MNSFRAPAFSEVERGPQRSGQKTSLARFQEAISLTCAPVQMRPTGGARFSGALRSVRADGLLVAQLRTTPTAVTRTGRLLTSTDPEFVKLAWQRHGTSRLEQDGRRCVVPAAGPHRVTLADRIRAHALANLGDPGLCVESIAASLAVSVRQVHKACAQEGFTAAAWIRRQRLERIRRDLLDPTLAGRSTAAIAARWGLLDVTHLARQFRAAFGESPAELRRAAG